MHGRQAHPLTHDVVLRHLRTLGLTIILASIIGAASCGLAGTPATTTSSSGSGTKAELSASTTNVTFGDVTVGNQNSQPILLQNVGSAMLTFSQVAVAGAGFSETGLSTSTTIAPGGSTTFTVAFAPSSAVAISGSVTLTTNGTPSVLVIDLSGTGTAAALGLSVSATTLSFGNVSDGTSSSLPLTLKNTGNANLTVQEITVSGAGFSASGIANGTVMTAGQSLPLTVTFAPTSAGTVSGASLTITSQASNSPATVTLSGTGMHVVKLQWVDTSTGSVTYNVFRGTSTGQEGPTPINPSPVTTTEYIDLNVSGGQSYFYTVEALTSSGTSAPSTEVQVNVPTP